MESPFEVYSMISCYYVHNSKLLCVWQLSVEKNPSGKKTVEKFILKTSVSANNPGRKNLVLLGKYPKDMLCGIYYFAGLVYMYYVPFS